MHKRGLVLDTDIGTDVDDAFALAYALRSPRLELHAVTTVSGDTRARAHIAARLLATAGRDDVTVASGVGHADDGTWAGHEGIGLSSGPELSVDARPAVDVLLAESRSPEPPVVATIGLQSNVAAAVTRDESYPCRVPLLAVMGGVFASVELGGRVLPPRRDYNLMTDAAASVRSLNAGFATLYTPIDVTFRVPFRARHLERLRAGDALCRDLARLADVWRDVMHARAGGMIPDDVVAYMHDPLTVACVATHDFVTTERLPVTVAIHDGVPRTFVDPIEGRPADVVTGVDSDAFVDHWLTMVTDA